MQLKVKSALGNGPIITENLMIRLSMYQINGAQSVMVPMSVSYRECEVVEYTTPKIEDLEFTYQSFDPLAIFFDFDQGSCIC